MDIFEFDDFKLYLRKLIANLPKAGHGQNKRFAEAAGVSTAFFSQILSGKRQISIEQASLLTDFLGLSDLRADYFLLLVELDRAGNESLRKRLRVRKSQLKKSAALISKRFTSTTEVGEKDQPIYYSDWIYIAIQQLTAIEEFQTEFAIAEKLNLSLKKVREVTDFLKSTGLCVEKSGRLMIGPARLHLSPQSPWIKQHHSNWRLRSLEEFNKEDPAKLFYSSPMTLSKNDYEKIRALLVSTIQSVAEIVDPSPSEELVCLNIDWFKIGNP